MGRFDGFRILITGATGLVGSRLAANILKFSYAEVLCLVRDKDPQSIFYSEGWDQKVKTVYGELEDFRLMERIVNDFQPQIVFHLAAQTLVGIASRDPFSTWESNVRGTYNLLEALRRTKTQPVSIIVASSDKAYGNQLELPYTEEMPLDGVFPYDASKSITDILCRTYSRTYGMHIITTRCGNIFGPGDLNWSRIVPGTIRACIKNEPIVIRSNGKLVRDYIYVDDVVNAYVELATCQGLYHMTAAGVNLDAMAFNISEGEPMSVLDIVERIRKECKHDRGVDIQNTASHEIEEQYLDSSLIRSYIGWQPSFGFKYGMNHTIAWYRHILK